MSKMENNSEKLCLSVEFDTLLPKEEGLNVDARIAEMLACVAYHSAVINNAVVDWAITVPGQAPASMSTIDRLVSEFQYLASTDYKVGRGGNHIWVAYPNGRRIFSVMFR